MTTKKYSLTNDCIFHRVFGREDTKNNLLYLINAVFAEIGMQQIVHVTIMDSMDYGIALMDKSVVYDIKAKTSNDELVNIEVQLENKDNYIGRSYYYLSKIHGSQLEIGGKYKQIKASYGISFLNFVLFKEFPEITHNFIPTHSIYKDCVLKENQMVYIEMPKVQAINKNSTAIEKLVYLLNNADRMEDDMANDIVFEDPALNQIYQDYRKVTENREFMALLEAKEKFRRDAEAEKDFVEARGKAEGKAEGLAEGLVKGEARGEAKGLAKGKAERDQVIVQSMHAEGFDIATIARITKLSEAEVQHIIAAANE